MNLFFNTHYILFKLLFLAPLPLLFLCVPVSAPSIPNSRLSFMCYISQGLESMSTIQATRLSTIVHSSSEQSSLSLYSHPSHKYHYILLHNTGIFPLFYLIFKDCLALAKKSCQRESVLHLRRWTSVECFQLSCCWQVLTAVTINRTLADWDCFVHDIQYKITSTWAQLWHYCLNVKRNILYKSRN